MARRGSILSELVRVVLPVAILAAGVAGLLVLKGRQKELQYEIQPERPPLVQTVPVAVHRGGLDIEVDGVVVPFREITLSAEVDGTIQYKADVCRAGRYVNKDTLLLKIDPRDYELEIRRLVTGLDRPGSLAEALAQQEPDRKSLIGLAQRELQLQQKELQRLKGLFDTGTVSDAEIDQGERSVIAAENNLLSLRSQLEKARLSLQRTQIRSPIDGVVVSDLVEQGDFVRRGTPLVTIEDTSKVEVQCSLRMQELYWLWNQAGSAGSSLGEDDPQADYQIPNAPATVTYRLAGRDYQWEGVLWRYEGIGLDENSRTVPCRVVVEAPRQRKVRLGGLAAAADQQAGPPALVRGMYVKVNIHTQPNALLLELPEAAVRPGGKVWVVRDGKLAIVDVEVVRVARRVAVIRAGELRPDDKAVVSPLAAAENGMTVREQSEQ